MANVAYFGEKQKKKNQNQNTRYNITYTNNTHGSCNFNRLYCSEAYGISSSPSHHSIHLIKQS